MFALNIQLFAHKKGVGSTKNGRDSESKLYFTIFQAVCQRLFVRAVKFPLDLSGEIVYNVSCTIMCI